MLEIIYDYPHVIVVNGKMVVSKPRKIEMVDGKELLIVSQRDPRTEL